MSEQTTRDIVLECATAIEEAKKRDRFGSIDLLPYFLRVINRTLEAAARIAESTVPVFRPSMDEPIDAYRFCCGLEIAALIRAKVSPQSGGSGGTKA